MNTTTEAHKLVANLTISLKNAADCLNALSKQVANHSGDLTTLKVKRAPKNGRRGRRVGSTKLGEEKEAQIIELLNRPGVPIPVAAIAKAFGVSRPTIYNIRDKSKLDVRRRDRRSTNRIMEEIQAQIKNSASQAESMEPQAAAS